MINTDLTAILKLNQINSQNSLASLFSYLVSWHRLVLRRFQWKWGMWLAVWSGIGQLIHIQLNGERLCSQVNLISSCCSGWEGMRGLLHDTKTNDQWAGECEEKIEEAKGAARTASVKVHNPLLTSKEKPTTERHWLNNHTHYQHQGHEFDSQCNLKY